MPLFMLVFVFLGILLFAWLGQPFDLTKDQALERAEREIVRLAREQRCEPTGKISFEPVETISEGDGYYFEVEGHFLAAGRLYSASMWIYPDFGFWFFKIENVDTLGTTIRACNQGD